MKKMLALLFALTLCLGGLTAFAEDVTVSAENEFPIVEEKIELDVWCYLNATCEDIETNVQTSWYEDKTNIHVNWTVVPKEEATTKLNLSIASGDYPDIYMTPLSTAQITSMAEAGILLPLNDLIEEHAYYTKQGLEENPHWRDYITAPDGNIYTLFYTDIGAHMRAQEKMFVNADWYEKYTAETGKTVVTTEDFRDMLTYFRDNDMNGNGDATDEIPLIGSTDGWSANPLYFLMNAFQLVDSDTMLLVDENDQVVAPFITDGWREGLRYIKSLYDDGLIAEETFVQDSTQMMALASKATPEEMIVGTSPNCWQGGFCDSSVCEYTAYAPIDPLQGPDGTRQTAVRDITFLLGCGITTACEHPEAAIKWLDYWMGFDGMLLNTKGWEGVNYEWRDDEISLMGTYPGLHEFKMASVGSQQNDYWYMTWIGIDTPERRYSCVGEPGSSGELLYSAANHYINEYGVDMNWPSVTWGTPEQVAQVALLQPTIMDYVESCAVQFILGGMDIDADWEMYLDELNAMGLEDYLDVQTKIVNGIA